MAGEKVFGTGAYDGDDLLMAAITGEEVPEEAARSAEYREAVADLGQLRLVLRDLGEELAAEPAAAEEPEPTEPPVRAEPVRVRRRRMFAVAVRAVAVAGVAAAFGGVLWLGANNGLGSADGHKAGDSGQNAPGLTDGNEDNKGGDAEKDADSSEAAQDRAPFDRARQIACTRILVEGTATELAPHADGTVDVTVKVDRWYRPERTAAEQPTTTVALPEDHAADISVGEPVLISVYRHPEDGYDVETGWGVADVRPELLAALPEAKTLDCPNPLKS
ncbi:hypothetical protein [Streptomyces indicus]|uniref:Uncharacterized protein n=1 Tax=Streptomyces indicus TaxID=417292 RepID=A0A1G9GE95_9ACTN|nr:hypothetical protein [Streptomyces indicus]SDK98980.1 hypothetical protein SAMN05421806_115174 [Streptomyces indicus]